MRRFPNFGPLATIIVVAIVIGSLVGWWASRTPSQIKATTPQAKPAETAATETKPEKPIVAPAPPAEALETPTNAQPPVTAQNWEDRVDEILGDDKTDTDQKADLFADMVPKLPEDAAREVAEHLINLVSDEDFYKKTAAIVTDPKTPKSVASVIFDDMMNRNDGLRLPLTLKIAQDENHPLHQDAKEMLEMSLQEDFGTDWAKWKAAIDESLKNQGLDVDPHFASLIKDESKQQ